jgi:hypothetical protein
MLALRVQGWTLHALAKKYAQDGVPLSRQRVAAILSHEPKRAGRPAKP